jgi:hypothetical protein
VTEKVAYVYRLGETGIYKVGKTTDLERRRKTFETISTEPLELHAAIETSDHTEVENFMKERLQARRWLEGPGKDLYEAERDEVDAVIEAARRFSADTLPRIGAAATLTKTRADGRVLTPGQIERDLHRELLEWRQAEARAQQEMRRIKTELMLLMQTASRLDGIVVWESRMKPTFEEARFKRENAKLAEPYIKYVHERSFKPRW